MLFRSKKDKFLERWKKHSGLDDLEVSNALIIIEKTKIQVKIDSCKSCGSKNVTSIPPDYNYPVNFYFINPNATITGKKKGYSCSSCGALIAYFQPN